LYGFLGSVEQSAGGTGNPHNPALIFKSFFQGTVSGYIRPGLDSRATFKKLFYIMTYTNGR